MQTATILVSRFRDSLTPGALPIVDEFDGEFSTSSPGDADLISVHRHTLDGGRCLVFFWSVSDDLPGWRQDAVISVPCDQARLHIPAGFVPIECPPEFGISAWKAARS